MSNVAIPQVLSLFPTFLTFLTTFFIHPANFSPTSFVIPVTIRQAEWNNNWFTTRFCVPGPRVPAPFRRRLRSCSNAPSHWCASVQTVLLGRCI